MEVCRNITDVDDHLLVQAKEEGVPWKSLATQQSYRFETRHGLLGMSRPAYEPRSHDHVDGVITLAVELLASGPRLRTNGSVYFRGGAVHETAASPREGNGAGGRTRRTSRRPNKDDPLDAASVGAFDRGASRRGRARGVRGGPAGTPSARPWRSRPSAHRGSSRRGR